jgi:hypothetical protein
MRRVGEQELRLGRALRDFSAKVVVALRDRIRSGCRPGRDGDFAGRASGHFADAPERQFKAGGDLAMAGCCAGGGEAEFVVVAAGQLAIERHAAQVGVVAAPLPAKSRRCGSWTSCTAAAQPSVRNVAEVGQQAIGNVDGGAGDADQCQAEGNARARFFQRGDAQARPRRPGSSILPCRWARPRLARPGRPETQIWSPALAPSRRRA